MAAAELRVGPLEGHPLEAVHCLPRALDGAQTGVGDARMDRLAAHRDVDVDPAAIAHRYPLAGRGHQQREIGLLVEHGEDRLGAFVARPSFVVDRDIERAGEFRPGVVEKLEDGERDRLVRFVLPYPHSEHARLVAAPRGAGRDLPRPRIVHQIVVLDRRVDLDQQRLPARPGTVARDDLVARHVDQIVGAGPGELRPQHVLHVVDELRIVRLHEDLVPHRHVGRDPCQLDQRVDQETPVNPADQRFDVHTRSPLPSGLDHPLTRH